jgi:ribonuclease PH
MTSRFDGRALDEGRPLSFHRDYTEFAAGSVLVSVGRTRVLCTASVEEDVPRWLRGTGKGWVTAEYSMLPGSTAERAGREAAKGKQSGRTQEIQRLIGRSLRSVTRLNLLPDLQIIVDCDVLQADGGTRTASITGASVAVALACAALRARGQITRWPLRCLVAAVSVGVVDERLLLDLNYQEDKNAAVDMNLVMTSNGAFVEVQGAGEEATFSRGELDTMLALGEKGIQQLIASQRDLLQSSVVDLPEF